MSVCYKETCVKSLIQIDMLKTCLFECELPNDLSFPNYTSG